MNLRDEIGSEARPSGAKPPVYEPPGVEEVLDARDLAREVQYAGAVGSVPPPP